MNSPNGFSQKTVNLEGRSFSIRIQEFENGYFVSVSEGTNKIGSMMVSLSAGPASVTTTIIPSRSESLFLKLTAERISMTTKRIAIVSAFVQKELEPDTTKTLMAEIMDMIAN